MRLLPQPQPQAKEIRRANPASAYPSQLTFSQEIQNHAGNQAIQQLFRSGHIQAKLATSYPDDPAEREAENVASAIMRKAAGAPCSCSPGEEMCEDCQQKQSSPAIQRRASSPAAPAHVPRIVSDVLRSPGHPLNAATRAFFEPRFGHDFSHVRVHTDSRAADSARSIHAHAYTAGSDIVFAAGQYSPATDAGRSLLAHELTHVTQQSGGVTVIQRDPDDNPEDREGPLTEAEEKVLKRILKIANQKKIHVGVQAKIEIEGDPVEDIRIKTDEPFTEYPKERAEALGGTGRAVRLPEVDNPPKSPGKAGYTQPSSGVVIEPAKGSHEIEVLTWNTGDPVKFSDVSHAETQFEKWLESRDPKWLKRVKSITITVFGRDICEECEGRLKNLEKQYPHIKFNWVSGSSGAPLKNYRISTSPKKRPKGEPSGSSGEAAPTKKPAIPETPAAKPDVEPPATPKAAEPASKPSPSGPESTTDPTKAVSKPTSVPESTTNPPSTAHESEAQHRGSQRIMAIDSFLNLVSSRGAKEFGEKAAVEALNWTAPRLMSFKAAYDSFKNLYAAWGTENFWITATQEAYSWTLNAMGPLGQAVKVAYKFHFAALGSMIDRTDFAESIKKSAEELEQGVRQFEFILSTLQKVESELPLPFELASDFAFWGSLPQAFNYLDEYWHVAWEVSNRAADVRSKLIKIIENWRHIEALAEQADAVTRGPLLQGLAYVDFSYSKNGKNFEAFVQDAIERAKTIEYWTDGRASWAQEALQSYGYFGKYFRRGLTFTECNEALKHDTERWVQECFSNRWEDWVGD